MSELNELEEYIDKVQKAASQSIAATKEQIDLESRECFAEIEAKTPRKEGELASSLKMTKIDDSNRYGYKIEFVGTHSSGINNEKLANVLNHGTKTIPGRHFRTRALRRLRGMDGRIYIRWQKKVKENF